MISFISLNITPKQDYLPSMPFHLFILKHPNKVTLHSIHFSYLNTFHFISFLYELPNERQMSGGVVKLSDDLMVASILIFKRKIRC